MEIFRFDRGEKIIHRYGSKGLHATRIAVGNGGIQLMCLTLAPDGVIGTHSATEAQLFLVIAGEGWAAGPGRPANTDHRGVGCSLGRGRRSHKRTEAGMTVVTVEGQALDLFEPEAPDT